MSARQSGLALATLAFAAALAGLAACESATNLDVSYGDASSALEGSAGDEAAAVGPKADAGILPGCPCEERAGLGCCLPKSGNPFCTSLQNTCALAHGTFLGCVRPDPTSESVCCWHPDTKNGALTALAAACDGGRTACQNNGDCAGTGKPCTTATCFGGTITIGVCDTAAPECMQP